MKAEKFNHPLLNMMNSPSSAADVWTRKQPETDTENKESVGDVNLPPVHTYDELKKMRRNAYIKMVAIVGIIVTALAFGSVAWFTENREVEGSGVQMTGKDFPFYLASAGDNIGDISYHKKNNRYETTAVNDMNGAVKAKAGKTVTYNGKTYYTANIDEEVLWNLESSYNPKDDGIHPDSSGEFKFYLIPTDNKGFTTKLTLHIEGYNATVSRNVEDETSVLADYDGTFKAENLALIGNSDAEHLSVEYLNRRMLFFGGGSKGSYTDFKNDKTITLTYTDAQVTKGVPLEVTIKWIWPKTFCQMACIGESENITNDSDTISKLREYIVAEPEKLFSTERLSGNEALEMMADKGTDPETGDPIYTFNSSTANQNIVALSEGYNMADNAVGKDIKYFLLSITVD